MPELPEIAHHAENLSRSLKHKMLDNIVIRQGPYSTSEKEKYLIFRNACEKFKPHFIKEIKTKGKYMYFLLEGDQHYSLGIHHGMEGSWCTDSANKHIILELKYSQKNKSYSKEKFPEKIFFQDSRRFGTFSLLSKEELEKKLGELGPDVLRDLDTSKELKDLIDKKYRIQDKRLCEVLMDQSFISGIGNYLRADIMYEAKLDPTRIIDSFSDNEIEKLFDAIKKIVKLSYDSKATTCGNYSSSIHQGYYDPLIYGKKKCPSGGKIECFKDKQKRTVWWVPAHQK